MPRHGEIETKRTVLRPFREGGRRTLRVDLFGSGSDAFSGIRRGVVRSEPAGTRVLDEDLHPAGPRHVGCDPQGRREPDRSVRLCQVGMGRSSGDRAELRPPAIFMGAGDRDRDDFRPSGFRIWALRFQADGFFASPGEYGISSCRRKNRDAIRAGGAFHHSASLGLFALLAGVMASRRFRQVLLFLDQDNAGREITIDLLGRPVGFRLRWHRDGKFPAGADMVQRFSGCRWIPGYSTSACKTC